MKKILTFFLAALLICSLAVTAYAHDVPDLDREGSIQIVVKYGGKAVSGGKLKCIQVGEVYEDDGNYSFVRVLDGEAVENIQSPKLAKELEKYAKEKALTGKTVTVDKKGEAVFEGLKPGLYLIVQTKAASGYEKLAPFLVSLPYMEDGEYRYDVTAAIKSELKKVPETVPPTTQKDSKLPQTGQLNWPVPLLAVLGMGLFAAGWAMRIERKKDDYAK